MPIPWDDDATSSLSQIAQNAIQVTRRVATQATSRVTPSTGLAFDWHRTFYLGISLPVPYYAGEVRDSDPRFPELIGYDVEVGGQPGVSYRDVPDELVRFERGMQTATRTLDAAIAPGTTPVTPVLLAAVVSLAAYAHGEWVRIHPFANGNGRTARCWANFAALRYGLPAFVTLKPRPGSLLYAQAGRASMNGDHAPTEAMFRSMLVAALGRP